MDLSIVIAPGNEDAAPVDAALASPMSKNQRRLSLSAKWANDKALAFEYLKRQREVVIWMEQILGEKLPSKDLHESLRSGIVLRELLEKLFPDTTHCLSPISRNYSSRMAPWKERENITVFLKQCKVLGMNDLSLFCTDDLYDGNNMVQVMFCIQDFMRFSQEHSGHFLHPVYDEHVTFSNQEVEMAMSKIEKAGMDASKLKELMGGSSTGSPTGMRGKSGSEDDTDADSLLAGSDTEPDLPDSDEKVLDELEGELQALAGDDGHFCNQSSVPHDIAEDSDEDFEPALDGEIEDDGDEADDEVAGAEEDEEGVEEDDEEEIEFDDDEKEIIVLLNDIVDTLEEELEGGEEEQLDDDDDEEVEKDEEVPIEKDDNDKMSSAARELEEARHMEIPTSAASEIMDSDVFVSILDEKPRIESEEEGHTELMDVGKSETLVLPGTAMSAQGNTSAEATSSNAKPSKTKLRFSRKKKNREASDEQLEAEVMSRCTCGNNCSIM